MTTTALTRTAEVRTGGTLTALARIEAVRFVRHPLYVLGALLALGASTTARDTASPSIFDYPAGPAFFVGVFGFVVAYRLTASTRRSAEVLDGCPSGTPLRTAALCLACLVPFLTGLVVSGLTLAFVRSAHLPGFVWGTYGGASGALVLVGVPAVACLGGPIAGVAAARWLRFPGADLLLATALVTVCALAAFATVESAPPADSVPVRLAHLVTPYTSFGSSSGPEQLGVQQSVTSYPGSPAWYVAYLLVLTALAAVVALSAGAQGRLRRRLRLAAAGLAVLVVATLLPADLGGNAEPMLTRPDGTTVVRGPVG